jgi:zinc protease
VLEQQFFRNDDPLKILRAPERIKQLTVAKTKTLANRFLDDKNVAKLVLLPAKK